MSATEFIYTSINFKRRFFSTNNGTCSLLLHCPSFCLTPRAVNHCLICCKYGLEGLSGWKRREKCTSNTGRKAEGNSCTGWEPMDASSFWGYSCSWVYLRKIWKFHWRKSPAQGTRHLWYFSGTFPGLTTTLYQRLKICFQLKWEEKSQPVQEFPTAGLAGGARRLQFATAYAEQSPRRSSSTSLLEGDKKEVGRGWTSNKKNGNAVFNQQIILSITLKAMK